MRPSVNRYTLQRTIGAMLMVALLTAAKDESKHRHAIILGRVLSYELTLEERMGDAVGIAVVYDRGNQESEANADAWLDGLAELSSMKIKGRPFFALKVPFGISELNWAVTTGADVLLVVDGLDAESSKIAEFARSRRVLTMGSHAGYVQTGLTLSVVEEAGKSKIFINLNAAQFEGIRFSSRLLALVTLIR